MKPMNNLEMTTIINASSGTTIRIRGRNYSCTESVFRHNACSVCRYCALFGYCVNSDLVKPGCFPKLPGCKDKIFYSGTGKRKSLYERLNTMCIGDTIRHRGQVIVCTTKRHTYDCTGCVFRRGNECIQNSACLSNINAEDNRVKFIPIDKIVEEL